MNTNTTRETVVRKLKSRIDRFNDDLAALETRAERLTDSARAEVRDTLADLRQKRDQAQRQLGELGDASDSAFDDLVDGIEKGWDEVSASFERARQRFH
jgi:predicted  nucleic acid-binding Zn-ribbon protein